MTNIQGAIGCGQLKNISWIVKRKKEIGRRYISILNKCNKIYIQPNRLKFADNIFWVFGVLIKKKSGISRDKLVKMLLKRKTQTRNFFHPMHKQKIFKKMKVFSKKEKLPNSEYLSKNGFYLPSGLGITNKEIDVVGNALLNILKK